MSQGLPGCINAGGVGKAGNSPKRPGRGGSTNF